jgi:hypothetical protein
VADKLVVYGGLKAFPNFAEVSEISCTQTANNFCYLENLRLKIPDAGAGRTSLDEAFAEEIQVISLILDQANVIQGGRGLEQTEFYDKNLVRGRFWHQTVAIEDRTMVVAGGVTKVAFENRPAQIGPAHGVDLELCQVGQNTVCNHPSRAVGSNQRIRFRFHGGPEAGRAEFQMTRLPGDLLLVTGGRGGSDGINPGQSTQAATGVGQLGVAPFVR